MAKVSLPYGFKRTTNSPVDGDYLNNGVPYASVSEVNTIIDPGVRHVGLTVNVNNEDYWYKDGTADINLVLKQSGGSSNVGVFTDLQDVPSGYTNNAGSIVTVKQTEDGLDFIPSNVLLSGLTTQQYVDDNYVPNSSVGQPNGVTPLDNNGKIDLQYLNISPLNWKGSWDASTNTPTLGNGLSGHTSGDVYRVNVSGTTDLGAGLVTYLVSDYVIYNGTQWEKLTSPDAQSFLDLIDTPGSYTGQGNKILAVKPTEDGVEFITPPSSALSDIIYNGSVAATREVGGITVGFPLSGNTLEYLLTQQWSPYTAPTITNTVLTPSSSAYNQLNVVYNVTFRWVKNVGTSDFVSAQVQYKRAADSTWNNLTTNVTTVNSTTRDASATVTVNPSTPNNDSVQFRTLFTDASQTNTSITVTATFAGYIAPSASLTVTPTPGLTSGKMIRSLSTQFNTVIGGTITRNSSNINLNQYKIQRDYNDSVWTDLNSLTNIANAGGSISPTVDDNTQPANKNIIRYRAFVTDSQVTGGQGISATSQFGIFQPILYGMSSASSISAVDLSTLTIVPNGGSTGQVNYTNTSSDKTINGLSFTASSNRFCIAFDVDYGSLTKIFNTGTQTNLLANPANFITGTKSLIFADGTVKTYNVYLYASVVVSDSYIIDIA